MERNVLAARRFGWAVALLPVLAIAVAGCSGNPYGYTGCGTCCAFDSGCGVPGLSNLCNPYGYTDCGARICEDVCCPTPPKPCDYPKEAKPCETWCQVFVPGETKTVCEEVCVTCPGCRRDWVPPVTVTKSHDVCVCPACAHDITTPAVWETLSECVQVCPGQFEQRCRRVCVQCEQTHTVYEPAKYETCVEECVVCPGFWKDVPVPAVMDKRNHLVCVRPARWEWRHNTSCEPPKPPAVAPAAAPPAPTPNAAH